MVNPDDFKNKIEQLISQDYKVEFLGKNFDQIVNFLTEKKAEKIYRWIEDVVFYNISITFFRTEDFLRKAMSGHC